ncbi:hypothetical protein HK101_006394 [Irineochytrium annulatum]|nr:hypothetical protein HK101_006394 [Irineochytrium annulatum]
MTPTSPISPSAMAAMAFDAPPRLSSDSERRPSVDRSRAKSVVGTAGGKQENIFTMISAEERYEERRAERIKRQEAEAAAAAAKAAGSSPAKAVKAVKAAKAVARSKSKSVGVTMMKELYMENF